MSDSPTSSTANRDALAHELRVHQIELEQQNEELQRTQSDLALAHDRYRDLCWALGRETPQRIDLTMNFADGTLPPLILEHRARPLGGRLGFDAAPDGSGWIGPQLTQNLDLKEAPVNRAGRPA